MPSPGTVRSTGPSPATVTTSQPRRRERVGPVTGHDRDAVGQAEAEGTDGHGAHVDGILPRSGADLLARGRAVLEAHWRPEGFCVPNPTTYPWQWLWDSCFHAVTWAHLGDDRAVVELTSALADIDGDGFVPHIRYPSDPGFDAGFWGRRATSSITQPPMYGHAVAELVRLGFDVPGAVVERAGRGLRFLLDRRPRSAAGLVPVCHPWETGCDDSPRWDHWRPDPTARAWWTTKGALLASVERSDTGAPLHNPSFAAAPAGFNALVAFNARELAAVTGDQPLRATADGLAEAIDARWNGTTWVDDGDGATTSGGTATLDGLLPALLGGPHASDAVASFVDTETFGAPYGPRGVSRSAPAFDPTAYWRGPAWPQLSYLAWLAATRTGSDAVAASVRSTTIAGASSSGWAEYWDADSGAGLGARPQSWTSLVAVLASDQFDPRVA